MPQFHDTAYPTLSAEFTAAELDAAFTPTPTEIRFARSQSRRTSTTVLILVQFKLLQRLGYFPMLVDVPAIVIDHVRATLRASALPRAAVKRYDASGTRSRHQKLLRGYLHIWRGLLSLRRRAPGGTGLVGRDRAAPTGG